MTRKRWIDGLAAAGVLAFFAAACESGGPDSMTEDEAAAVMEMVGSATVGPLAEVKGGSAKAEGGATEDRGPDGRGNKEGEFEREKDCPEGGTVTISGTISGDKDDESHTWHMRVNTEFDRCTKTNREDVTLTLTGTVAQDLTKTTTYDGKVVTIAMDGSWTGSVAWEKPDEDESGVCEIDVTMDVDIVIDYENRTREIEGGVRGTACGVEVDTMKKRGWLSFLF